MKTEIVEINGCKLSVRRTGRGKPLLWLHGTDGLTEWPQIIDRLVDEGHEVLAPDHPGFGATPVPDWMDDVSDLAYLYIGLIERLDLAGVALVGHSLGGWIAAEMAVRSTFLLDSLVLISAAGIHVKGHPKADIFMIDPDEQARLAYASPELGQAAGERASAAKYQETAIANRVASARFGWNPRFHNPRLERWLGRIDIPTLIVWGDSDRIFAPVHAESFRRAIPTSDVAIIANAGHLPHVEQLDETHAVISGFLAD